MTRETTTGPTDGWFKSSYSENAGGCVEVRFSSSGTGVRDSKDRSGPVLTFSTGDWRSFLTTLTADRL